MYITVFDLDCSPNSCSCNCYLDFCQMQWAALIWLGTSNYAIRFNAPKKENNLDQILKLILKWKKSRYICMNDFGLIAVGVTLDLVVYSSVTAYNFQLSAPWHIWWLVLSKPHMTSRSRRALTMWDFEGNGHQNCVLHPRKKYLPFQCQEMQTFEWSCDWCSTMSSCFSIFKTKFAKVREYSVNW